MPRLGFGVEHAWLRLLARLSRGYTWVEVDGLMFFAASRQERMLWRMRKRSYERLATKLFVQDSRPGTIVVDIGSHLGYYTLLAAREVGPAGRVYSFECLPENYRFLLHNVRANGYSANVVTLPQAVSNETGTLPFFVRGGDLTAGSLFRRDGARRTVEVACTTVDDVLAGQDVGVVKIDVEGGEIRALEGMKRTLAESRDPIIIVECFPYLLAEAGGSARELIDQIRGFGFDIRIIDEGEGALVEVDDELFSPANAAGPTYYRNLYCRKV